MSFWFWLFSHFLNKWYFHCRWYSFKRFSFNPKIQVVIGVYINQLMEGLPSRLGTLILGSLWQLVQFEWKYIPFDYIKILCIYPLSFFGSRIFCEFFISSKIIVKDNNHDWDSNYHFLSLFHYFIELESKVWKDQVLWVLNFVGKFWTNTDCVQQSTFQTLSQKSNVSATNSICPIMAPVLLFSTRRSFMRL